MQTALSFLQQDSKKISKKSKIWHLLRLFASGSSLKAHNIHDNSTPPPVGFRILGSALRPTLSPLPHTNTKKRKHIQENCQFGEHLSVTHTNALKKTKKTKKKTACRRNTSCGIFGAVAAENEAHWQLSFHRDEPSANTEMSSSSRILHERIKRRVRFQTITVSTSCNADCGSLCSASGVWKPQQNHCESRTTLIYY